MKINFKVSLLILFIILGLGINLQFNHKYDVEKNVSYDLKEVKTKNFYYYSSRLLRICNNKINFSNIENLNLFQFNLCGYGSINTKYIVKIDENKKLYKVLFKYGNTVRQLNDAMITYDNINKSYVIENINVYSITDNSKIYIDEIFLYTDSNDIKFTIQNFNLEKFHLFQFIANKLFLLILIILLFILTLNYKFKIIILINFLFLFLAFIYELSYFQVLAFQLIILFHFIYKNIFFDKASKFFIIYNFLSFWVISYFFQLSNLNFFSNFFGIALLISLFFLLLTK